MKAQRRHELKENDLDHMLREAWHYLEDNGKQLGIALFVLIAVVGGILLTARSRAAALENVWRRKAELRFDDLEVGKTSLASLATMTGEVSDPQFVISSLIEQGHQALRLAQQAPFPPDPDLTKQARSAYEQLLARFSDNPLASGLANLGLATVEENEFVKDHDPIHKQRAAAHLKAVADDTSLGGFPLQGLAIKRLNRLDETFTPVEFVSPPVPEELKEKTEQTDGKVGDVKAPSPDKTDAP